MTDPLALGEKLLSLLEESALATTYKPALLLALIDRAQEYVDYQSIPVPALAERVIELYWPQTLPYQTTDRVLSQSQTHGGRATIVAEIESLRKHHGTTSRTLPPAVRSGPLWTALVDRVEETLAEYPIPRLQRPYAPFLYEFTWSWQEAGGWSARKYRAGDRAITLFAGVGDALTVLGPLLRPFITRWWTEKAAKLNPDVEDARSVVDFEDFLFGRDRVALKGIAERTARRSAREVLLLQRQHRSPARDRPLRALELQRRRWPRQPRRRLPPLQQQQACDPRRARPPRGTATTKPSVGRRSGCPRCRAAMAARSAALFAHHESRLPPRAKRTTTLDAHQHRGHLRDARAAPH